MEEMNPQELAARRKRINRIKNGIVISIFSWMLLSLIGFIVVFFQMASLRKEISTTQPIQNTVNSMKEPTEQYEIITGIDSVDNMAGESDEHYVYLTFDGSPSMNTNRILDILKLYDVKATFFVVGNDTEEMKALYQRIVNEGHTLGMHSYSNEYSNIYASTESFTNDLNKLREYLKNITGHVSLYYRFPGGSGNQISDINMIDFVKVLNQEEITYFDWNVSAGDTLNDYSVEDVIESVTSGVKNYKTSIVLLHDADQKSTTVDALGPLIEALQKMDAKILPIDENTKKIQYIHADSVK